MLLASVVLTSGLHGTVTKGPTTPVCQVGMPCTAPAAHTTLVFTRAGVAKRTATDTDGRYRITLAPGYYAVRAVGARFGMRPTKVHVSRGPNLRLNFSIDTGIR
jgi:hypothetical protein